MILVLKSIKLEKQENLCHVDKSLKQKNPCQVGRIVQKKNLCQAADLPSLSEIKLLEGQEDKNLKTWSYLKLIVLLWKYCSRPVLLDSM